MNTKSVTRTHKFYLALPRNRDQFLTTFRKWEHLQVKFLFGPFGGSWIIGCRGMYLTSFTTLRRFFSMQRQRRFTLVSCSSSRTPNGTICGPSRGLPRVGNVVISSMSKSLLVVVVRSVVVMSPSEGLMVGRGGMNVVSEISFDIVVSPSNCPLVRHYKEGGSGIVVNILVGKFEKRLTMTANRGTIKDSILTIERVLCDWEYSGLQSLSVLQRIRLIAK